MNPIAIHIGFAVILIVVTPFYLFLSLMNTLDKHLSNQQRLQQHGQYGPGSVMSKSIGLRNTQRLIRTDSESANTNINTTAMSDSNTTISIEETIAFLTQWIQTLQDKLGALKGHDYEELWEAYFHHARESLLPWDHFYLTERMPHRRHDGSIFLSVASYRDENCPSTLQEAFTKASHPERLFVGLVQQNCIQNCRSGVLEQGGTVEAPPDDDCHAIFCEAHPEHCSQIRLLRMTEEQSLGPYSARFFASKLWWGESWYMQIDAHTLFLQDWDQISLDMLHRAPSDKPVVSHYPPGSKMNLTEQALKPGGRLCGPVFATNPTENQMVRLEGLGRYDRTKIAIPRFAPFAAAGYLLAHADLLKDVPFDPLLPWIFMGEEIVMSTRLWTSGYDMFSPTQAVVSHIYVREHKPKFWESVYRFLEGGEGRELEKLVLTRIKHQLGYPEAARDYFPKTLGKTLLAYVPRYGMGTARPLKKYLSSVGLDLVEKVVTVTNWCETGRVPPGMEHHQHLYPIENYVQEENDKRALEHEAKAKAMLLAKAEKRKAKKMAQKGNGVVGKPT